MATSTTNTPGDDTTTPVGTGAPVPDDGKVPEPAPSADYADPEGTLPPATGEKQVPSLLENVSSAYRSGAKAVTDTVSTVNSGVKAVTDSIDDQLGASDFKKKTARINAGTKALKEYFAANDVSSLAQQHAFLRDKGFDLKERDSIIEAADKLDAHEQKKTETSARIAEEQKVEAEARAAVRAAIAHLSDDDVKAATTKDAKKALLMTKLEAEKADKFESADIEKAADKAIRIEENNVAYEQKKAAKRAETEAKNANKKPFQFPKSEKLILATTLAVHAGTSAIGSIAGGAWEVTKGGGRLIKEEVVGLAKSSLDLGIQAGKTVVYPFGRIGFGAKNRAARALDWAINLPNPPAIVKASHAPVHPPEAATSATEESAPVAPSTPAAGGKKNILSRGFSKIGRGISSLASGTWNLTKRAWYRTQQGVLIAVATPLALVGGALEGAALAIPRDILGIHTKGEATVSETGSREIRKLNELTAVDGGVAGILYSGGKMVKDIFLDAPIRAFEEQLTTIKETPIEADAETPASSGGGAQPAQPAQPAEPATSGGGAEHPAEPAGEHHASINKKQSIAPVNKDKKGKGFLGAFKVVADAWREDDLNSDQFNEAVDAMDEAFGKEEGSFAGGMAKGLRSLLGPSDVIPLNYKELGKYMFKVKTREREQFWRSLNMVEFRKEFRVIIETPGITRLTAAMRNDAGKDEVKRQIANLVNHTGALDAAELGTLLDALEERLGIGPTTVAGKPGDLRREIDNVRLMFVYDIPATLPATGMVPNPRLNNLFQGAEAPVVVNYGALGAQIFDLKTAEVNRFITAFDAAKFNGDYPLISLSQVDLEALLDGDSDGSVKTGVKVEMANLLKSNLKLSKGQVDIVVNLLHGKLGFIPAGATLPVAPAANPELAIYNLLERIKRTLDDTNINRIFPPENATYGKFGEDISKIKGSVTRRDAVVNKYDQNDFEIYFRGLRPTATFDENVKTPAGREILKERIASLLGYPDKAEIPATEFSARLNSLITVLNTPPLTVGRSSICTDIEAVRNFMVGTGGTPSDDKLNRIYKPAKEVTPTRIDPKNFGNQLLALTDKADLLGFIRAFDTRTFNSANNFRNLASLNATTLPVLLGNPVSKQALRNEVRSFLGGEEDAAMMNIVNGEMDAKLDLLVAPPTHPALTPAGGADQIKIAYLKTILSTQAKFAEANATAIFL